MNVLVDTNILSRSAQPGHALNRPADDAVAALRLRGDLLYLVPQVLYEFWAVATRPVEANGFGWTSERTAKEVADLQERFPLLPDSPEIFTRWLELVKQCPVHGKRVHDARLVAVLQAHAVEHLITFNTSDFGAFPMLSLVDPYSVVNLPRK